jgi:hypothetical protein
MMPNSFISSLKRAVSVAVNEATNRDNTITSLRIQVNNLRQMLHKYESLETIEAAQFLHEQ